MQNTEEGQYYISQLFKKAIAKKDYEMVKSIIKTFPMMKNSIFEKGLDNAASHQDAKMVTLLLGEMDPPYAIYYLPNVYGLWKLHHEDMSEFVDILKETELYLNEKFDVDWYLRRLIFDKSTFESISKFLGLVKTTGKYMENPVFIPEIMTSQLFNELIKYIPPLSNQTIFGWAQRAFSARNLDVFYILYDKFTGTKSKNNNVYILQINVGGLGFKAIFVISDDYKEAKKQFPEESHTSLYHYNPSSKKSNTRY